MLTTYRINLKMTTMRQIKNLKPENVFIACHVKIMNDWAINVSSCMMLSDKYIYASKCE